MIRLPFLSRKSAAVPIAMLDRIDGRGPAGDLGVAITPEVALGVTLVWAAVRVISEDVAKLPARLKRRGEQSDTIARGEHEHRLLSSIGRPTDETGEGCAAMEWIEATVASAALAGRGVAELNRVGGIVRELDPIPFGSWEETGGKWRIRRPGGRWEEVSRRDLMVLRGPLMGRNVSQLAASSIAHAIHLERYGISLARKAGRPNGIVSAEGLDQAQAQTFVERIKEYFGAGGSGGLMPLDAKVAMTQLSLSPKDLEADKARAAVVAQIAGAFRVQPARLMQAMDGQTHASAYQWNIAHVSDTIQPWARRFTQAFDRDVLGPERSATFYSEIALQGLLAGSPTERAEFLLKLRTMGAASPRTVAQLEDMPTEGLSTDPAFPLLTNPPRDGAADAPASQGGGEGGDA